MVASTFSLRPARGAKWSGEEGTNACSTTIGAGVGMVGTGGGAGGGTRVRTKFTPMLSKSTISILDMSAVGSAATRKDWASLALSRTLRISRAVPPPSLLHCDLIQWT